MYRTREWRRDQKVKKNKEYLRRVMQHVQPRGTHTNDDRRAEVVEGLSHGKRHVRFWLADGCRCSYCEDGRRNHANRDNIPLDKELEAWYN
jgi:hypothetical protein